MWIYISWCIVAFIISFIKFLICLYYFFFEKWEIETENYKEIWWNYDFFSRDFWDEKYKYFIINFIIIFLLLPLLSWIYVIYEVFILIKKTKFYYFDLPKDIKEKKKKMEFKLKTKHLSKKEIYEIVYFINHGQKINDSWDLAENLLLWRIDTTPEGEACDRSHMYIYYNKVELWECYTPLVKNGSFDYKIEWNKVFWKAVEIRSEYPGEDDDYRVRDWKVLEDNIRAFYDSVKDPFIKKEKNDAIKNYKNLVKWNELSDYSEIKFYILYYNLSKKDFKTFAENKLDNLYKLKLAINKYNKICNEVCKKYDKKDWDKEINKKIKREKFLFTKDELNVWTYYVDKKIKCLERILSWELEK